MARPEPYNGWTNWETWCVNLWVTNEEATYRRMRASRPYTAAKAERVALEMFPEGVPDFADEGGAGPMGRVNWGEIAAAWNEE